MQIHWLWLNSRPGVGPIMALKLLDLFGSAEEIYAASAEQLARILRRDSAVYRGLCNKSLTSQQAVVRTCVEKGISILTMGDAGYPARLKQIADPPLVLYYRGRLPDFDRTAVVSVVGTRSATSYGLSTARRFGKELAEAGALVVSGLAGGIDSAAMAGAISAGGISVGVLGCGVDVVYPNDNGPLYGRTLERGCILSEYGPGTLPVGRNFPRRNRIISGLSCGVVVVEAPARSGALITASFALEQGRDVFAVPGNLDSPGSAGTVGLLRQGACLAESGWQIMEEYSGLFPSRPKTLRVAEPPSVIPTPAQKKVDNENKNKYSDKHKALPELSPMEQKLYSALDAEKIHVDELISKAGLNASQALVALTMLELKGLVRQHPGKYYSLA